MTNQRHKLGRELEPGDQILYEGMICTVQRRGEYLYAVHNSATVSDFADWILPNKTYIFVQPKRKKARGVLHKLTL